MANKEATARIKINKLLETAGWHFFAEGSAPANIQLEPSVTLKKQDMTPRRTTMALPTSMPRASTRKPRWPTTSTVRRQRSN